MLRQQLLAITTLIIAWHVYGSDASTLVDIDDNDVDTDDIGLPPPPGVQSFIGAGYDIIDGNPVYGSDASTLVDIDGNDVDTDDIGLPPPQDVQSFLGAGYDIIDGNLVYGSNASTLVDIDGNDTDDIGLPPPPGMQSFLGVGYDLIDGNPEGGEINNGGVDPGLKTTFRVFDLTYDKGLSSGMHSIPDQASYVNRESSVSTTSRDIFYGTQSYVKKLENDNNIEGGSKIIFGKFSRSKDYESVEAGANVQGKVYYEDKTVKLQSEARYVWQVAEQERHPLEPGFVVEACHLPANYTETNYMRFLQSRGTHVVTYLKLGMKTVERYEETTDGFVHYARESVSKSVGFRANVMGYRGGLAVNMDEFQSGLSAGMRFGSKTYTFTTGSPELPEPIELGLHEMDNVFQAAFWTRFDEYVAAGLCSDPSWITNLDLVAQNVATAMRGYAVWRNASAATDPDLVAIPIAWPKGKYTLPKPTTGCPNTHFTFQEGWRFHDTENFTPNNHWSSPYHLYGFKASSSMEQWFCSKTREEEDVYDWPFQEGKYCVMRKGHTCPQGLKGGSIYWDDENRRNGNKFSGDLPAGEYGSNTLIRYCCQTDGETSVPIYLPTDHSFFLMKYYHECQQVHGMVFTNEYFRWDTEDRRNSDRVSGYHPYPGHPGDIMIEYCYYQPASTAEAA